MQRHPLHRLAAVLPRVSRLPLRDANASATALTPAMRNANIVRQTVQNANALLPPCASSPLSCRHELRGGLCVKQTPLRTPPCTPYKHLPADQCRMRTRRPAASFVTNCPSCRHEFAAVPA
ncbi:hypothetical protein B0H13DRAFT_2370695 [Mycena leptocephala]|nr:hypothetical protein B0H13DRAFT_2370695 [Mycena leptocephala]